jgi:hypothetical protein
MCDLTGQSAGNDEYPYRARGEDDEHDPGENIEARHFTLRSLSPRANQCCVPVTVIISSSRNFHLPAIAASFGS